MWSLLDISIDEDLSVSESFEVDDETIFEGIFYWCLIFPLSIGILDQIGYLKSLHPHLKKSFEELEKRYEDEFFLREILTQVFEMRKVIFKCTALSVKILSILKTVSLQKKR